MRKFREEAPRVVVRGERLYELAKQIAGWAEQEDRKTGTWVAGVWGGRGTGKTSLLLTILEILSKRRDDSSTPVVILPRLRDASSSGHDTWRSGHEGKKNGDQESPDVEALFHPSSGRDGEDLLFLLLQHIESRYCRVDKPDREVANLFNSIRSAEVRRKDLRPFLDYDKDVGVSLDDVRERFVRAHTAVADTTRQVKESFGKLIPNLWPGSGRPFILCVDDLDLRPDRALELLEMIALFLRHRGVIVLIAADRDLMLSSVDEALKKRDLHQPGLAGALVSKLIPYGWALPVPRATERFDCIWAAQKRTEAANGRDGDDETPEWWPSSMQPLLNREARKADMRTVASEVLAPLLPHTFRGLTEYHNRLLSLRQEFGAAIGEAAEAEPFWKRVHSTLPDLTLHPSFVPAAVSAVAAADLRYPELGLLDALRTDPASLERALEAAERRDEDPETTALQPRSGTPSSPLSRGSANDLWMTSLLQRVDPSHDERGGRQSKIVIDARVLVERLARAFAWLRDSAVMSGQAAQRFIAVSVDADALTSSTSLWQGRFSGESEVVHLDVHSKGVSRETSRSARAQVDIRAHLDKMLTERGIRGAHGASEIVAIASLPLLVWLGWTLQNENAPLLFWNQPPGGEPLLFQCRRINFSNRLTSEWFRPGTALLGSAPTLPSGDAVVIFDVRGNSRDDQLKAFRLDGSTVETTEMHRLAPPERVPRFEPEALEGSLKDIVELLGQLKSNRGIRHVHLGVAAPDAVAFFLGQQLNGIGLQISLYEFSNGSYHYVFDLEPAL